MRCPWLLAQMKVATILGNNLLVGVGVLLGTVAQNHIRVYRRISIFCMGS